MVSKALVALALAILPYQAWARRLGDPLLMLEFFKESESLWQNTLSELLDHIHVNFPPLLELYNSEDDLPMPTTIVSDDPQDLVPPCAELHNGGDKQPAPILLLNDQDPPVPESYNEQGRPVTDLYNGADKQPFPMLRNSQEDSPAPDLYHIENSPPAPEVNNGNDELRR
jgi:hypothetical protein